MADIDITQAEADTLIAMEKYRVDDKDCLFPVSGARLAIALTFLDKREKFHARHHPVERYPNVQDLFSTFEAFLRHCNIKDVLEFRMGFAHDCS
jgi:hypothetical protein